MAFKSKYPELLAYVRKKYKGKKLGCIISVYTLQNLWSSPEMAKGLGYAQQEVEDMKMSKFLPWKSISVSRIFMEFFLRKGKQEGPTLTKDGKLVYVGGKAKGILFGGEPYLVGYDMYIRPAKEGEIPSS